MKEKWNGQDRIGWDRMGYDGIEDVINESNEGERIMKDGHYMQGTIVLAG